MVNIGNFVLDDSETVLIEYTGKASVVGIPSGVKIIGKKAFYNNSHIKRIYLSESVSIIDESAFENCMFLKIINLSNVKTIKYKSFYLCKSIEEINLSNSEIIESNAFSLCSMLKNIIFGNKVKEFGESSFSDTAIEEITLPDLLETVPGYSFYGCKHLKNIIFNNCLKSIKEFAFSGCSMLKKIIVSNSVEFIGYGCFNNIKSLEYIQLPSSLKECELFNSYVFENCNKLKDIVIFDNDTYYSYFGALYMKCNNKLLKYPPNRVSCIIYDKCEIIGNGAFLDSLITSVKLPDSVRVLEENAFFSSKYLESVCLTDNIKYIGKYAFSSINRLKYINMDILSEDCVIDLIGLDLLEPTETIITKNGILFHFSDRCKELIIDDSIKEIREDAMFNRFYNKLVILNHDVKFCYEVKLYLKNIELFGYSFTAQKDSEIFILNSLIDPFYLSNIFKNPNRYTYDKEGYVYSFLIGYFINLVKGNDIPELKPDVIVKLFIFLLCLHPTELVNDLLNHPMMINILKDYGNTIDDVISICNNHGYYDIEIMLLDFKHKYDLYDDVKNRLNL